MSPHADSSPSLTFVPYQAPGSVGRDPTLRRKRRWTSAARESNAPFSKIRNACKACREKKTRFSGHDPCLRCKNAGLVCEYMAVAYSHAAGDDSISASGTTRSSASRLYLLPERESAATPTSRKTLNYQEFPSQSSSPSATTAVDDTPDETLQEDQYGHLHGGASEFSFMHLAKQKLARLPPMSIHFSDYPLEGSGELPPCLPAQSVAVELLRGFFDFGLSTTRVLHETTLFESLEKLYSGASHLQADEMALLYIVMALGSHYSTASDAFCGYSKSVRFYDMARERLDSTTDRVTLVSSQARFLIIHYLVNHSRMHEAWSLFGLLVRHAQALGLHRRSQTFQSSPIVHEYHKRLFWAIYTFDKILSSVFGRPCAVYDHDIDQEECSLNLAEGPSATDTLQIEEASFSPSAAMVHYARVARILGKVLLEFYSPGARLQDLPQIHSTAIRFEKSLAQWQENLPVWLRYDTMPREATSTLTQRQMCTLKLMYTHTSLLLYRPFLLQSLGSTARGGAPNLDHWFKRCRDKSIEAARIITSEYSYLLARGQASRVFWLVNYAQFAAIGTLFMCSYIWEEPANARSLADEAMREFPLGVEGDMVGQHYLEVLGEVQMVTARSLNEDLSTAAAATGNGPGQETSFDFWDDDFLASASWPNLFLDANPGGEMVNIPRFA